MVLATFGWFLLTLLVSFSNVVVSVIIYWYLQGHKRLPPKMMLARDIAFFYSIGMMFVIIFSVGFFVLLIPA